MQPNNAALEIVITSEGYEVGKGGIMPQIGALELIVILAIVMIIFGAGRLPQIGGAMGRTVREFRKGQKEEEEALNAASDKD
jgi:sec-independent protein translocase protein TatA